MKLMVIFPSYVNERNNSDGVNIMNNISSRVWKIIILFLKRVVSIAKFSKIFDPTKFRSKWPQKLHNFDC
jgi:hypothetical protein